MHDYSLPSADRCDHAVETAAKPGLAAHVLLLADGNFFKAFRRGKPVLTVKSMHRAAFFFTAVAMDRVVRRLERRGIAVMPTPVSIIVGDR